ncbi:MAG: ribbon-helix-helix protein, CopG family, partial [Acidimicrobiia bacterium]
MSKPKTYRTPGGRRLTDADLDAIAEEVEHKDYDVEELKTRRRRPLIGSAPAEVVPVRLEPELNRAVDEHAEAEHLSASEVIRRALR